jgi:hypothetical protein
MSIQSPEIRDHWGNPGIDGREMYLKELRYVGAD